MKLYRGYRTLSGGKPKSLAYHTIIHTSGKKARGNSHGGTLLAEMNGNIRIAYFTYADSVV